MYNTFAILDNMIYHCWAWVNSESLRMTGTCPCVIAYTAKDGETFQSYDVNKQGGGLTDKTNKMDVKTIVSEKGHIVHDTEGNEVKKAGGEVLIHEIVGHAAPAIAGTETGNAVKNENIVRKELNLPERVEEEKHHE